MGGHKFGLPHKSCRPKVLRQVYWVLLMINRKKAIYMWECYEKYKEYSRKKKKNTNYWVKVFEPCAFQTKLFQRSHAGAIFMEQNMRFELILGPLAILKKFFIDFYIKRKTILFQCQIWHYGLQVGLLSRHCQYYYSFSSLIFFHFRYARQL